MIRMPIDLKRQVVQRAEDDHRTTSGLILHALRLFLAIDRAPRAPKVGPR